MMETRIFISDHKPAKFTARMIGETCWLEIEHDGNTVALVMPGRMDAAARMIAEAFNAHMMGGPITRKAQGETHIPSGGALNDDVLMRWAGKRSPGHAISNDDLAAHAVERRDLP